ncbi:MAG TPA: MucB/RseB C-terminal domain-containing protein [Rhodocyclaceae bacterium]|nr:MucB/RseB C-terminal domain-containing protein [Rhodocyclaceae bacterium]
MIGVLTFCLAGGFLALPALAQQQVSSEALQLLQKVATAAQKVTYTGVFVYQNGSRSETSRITHLIDGGNELERLEVLDGSPREVVRRNEEVKCFLPENKLLIVERRSARQFFPTLLPGSLAGLTEYYQIRKGSIGRVAGVDSQSILIEPRDEFRYGHQFWVDPQSGLLLKASLINELGQPLETFAFTELKIGGPMDKEMLKSQFEAKEGNWQIQQVHSSEVKGDDGQWIFRITLPGFRRISSTKRQLRPDAPESMQLIFSDGLAAMSVFLEPMAGRRKEEPEVFAMGAVNGYRRQVADYQVIVMGDVPPAALRRFADSLESKRK